MPRDRAVPKTDELDCEKQAATPLASQIFLGKGECGPIRVFLIPTLVGDDATKELNALIAKAFE
jgi:hypothetical protein